MHIETIIRALEKADPKQQAEIVGYFERGVDSWAGIKIGEIARQEELERFEKIRAGRVNFGRDEHDFQNPSVDAVHCDRLKGY
tara:strand:- start:22293 stop:22541 length:249 start_codon:yes stop_codon:yes gene_type:complete